MNFIKIVNATAYDSPLDKKGHSVEEMFIPITTIDSIGKRNGGYWISAVMSYVYATGNKTEALPRRVDFKITGENYLRILSKLDIIEL